MRPAKRGLALTRRRRIRWGVAAALVMAWGGTLVQFAVLPYLGTGLSFFLAWSSALGLGADCMITWLAWRAGMLHRR